MTPPLRIAVGTDHGGFEKKQQIVPWLREQGHAVIDCGCHTADSTDYPIYAARVAEAVSSGGADFGVLICRSGNGMAMTANRYTDVRAAQAWSVELARLARSHNDANVLIFGCDHLGEVKPEDMIAEFLKTEFEGGRHARRVDQIRERDTWADSALGPFRARRLQQSIWIDRSEPGSFTRQVADARVQGEGLRGIMISGEKADILDAADALMPVYDATGGSEGFACMPAPGFDRDDADAIARDLVAKDAEYDQQNLMFTLPATEAGFDAFEKGLRAGSSVCLAGVLTPADAKRAMEAYERTVTARLDAGEQIIDVRAILGVPVSVVDSAVNTKLEQMATGEPDDTKRRGLLRLRDRAALANCQRIHRAMMEFCFGESLQAAAARGAAPLQLLWMNTSAASPDMAPLYYIDELVAPYTVTLLTNSAWEQFLDSPMLMRGRLLQRGGEDDELKGLAAAGIDLDAVLAELRGG